MLRRCDAVITVDGYEDSAGSVLELVEARCRGIPEFHAIADLRAWLGGVA